MRVWFTADTHFGHGNIIKYCKRPFFDDEEQRLSRSDPQGRWKVSRETIREHDESILESINDFVRPDDRLWILGDFCWGDIEKGRRYRNRIRCRDVRLVWGNHDHSSLGRLFEQTIEQGMIRVRGQSIWLNHYPMRSWDKSFHGSWQLYGHVHGRMCEEDASENWRLTKDVGVDACDYRPISFEELEDYMEPRIKAFDARKRQLESKSNASA